MTPEVLIPADELAGLRTQLGEGLVADVVLEAEVTFAALTAGYGLAEEHRRRLVRALARRELFALAGAVPDAVQEACDDALAELGQICNGKLRSLADGGPVNEAPNSIGARPRQLQHRREDQDGL